MSRKMILDKFVTIKISAKSFKYYKSLVYDIHRDDTIEIPIEHLIKGSHHPINVQCDICNNKKMLSYEKYLKNVNNLNIYACSSKCSRIKAKSTSLNKFGNEHYSKTSECKEKVINTSIERYGVKNIFQNEDKKKLMRATFLKNYGVINPAQSNIIKDKMKQTCLIKYGTEYAAQDGENFIKSQKSGFKLKLHHNGLYYRGTYEKDFLDFCYNNNIQITQGKRISYTFENKKHYYFSDFYYEPLNLIIEIKSIYYFDKYLLKNIAKKEATIASDFKFIFIIDKNYTEFEKLILE